MIESNLSLENKLNHGRRNIIGAAAAVTAVTAANFAIAGDANGDSKRRSFVLTNGPRVSPPMLPYGRDELAPVISAETIDYHFGKHHIGYYNTLKDLLGGQQDGKDLEALIVAMHKASRKPDGDKALKVYNAAGQLFNHNFYWAGLRKPQEQNTPGGALAKAIGTSFGSLDAFTQQAQQRAVGIFGSGWLWLVMDQKGQLSLVPTSNADSPLTMGLRPLWVIDVWEHAYYIDFKNARAGHVAAVLKSMINWPFVEANFNLG